MFIYLCMYNCFQNRKYTTKEIQDYTGKLAPF